MPGKRMSGPKRAVWLSAILLLLSAQTGCAVLVGESPVPAHESPALTPAGETLSDLLALPEPKGPIMVAVYGFRDQTGQYRPSPASSFSTAVTQGAGSMLVKAALDSGWFVPVERENLQDLLTERKIARANGDQRKAPIELPPLYASNILLTGGIVAYETNVKTGGAGARYFGIGASEMYRMDQVTISLRAVDIRTGQILDTVSTSKTVYSYQLESGVFRFVKFKRLLELEAGFTRNEPAQLCVRDAIESAVVHLIAKGIKKGLWQLQNPEDMNSPVLRAYLREQEMLTSSD
jgi:curli production assembly/transport component CsgG